MIPMATMVIAVRSIENKNPPEYDPLVTLPKNIPASHACVTTAIETYSMKLLCGFD